MILLASLHPDATLYHRPRLPRATQRAQFHRCIEGSPSQRDTQLPFCRVNCRSYVGFPQILNKSEIMRGKCEVQVRREIEIQSNLR